MIIMHKMVMHRSMAVDKFSSPMRMINGQQAVKTYLKALRSAPFCVCIALRICATTSTTAPLAISEG